MLARGRLAICPWTQAGTAAGMFAFVPLGDMLPRRGLIIAMSPAIALAASLMALASGIALVNLAGFAIGLTTIVPHLVLPFAAKLAPAERRGHVVGIVLGGLLIGILLARVVSGYVGDIFGLAEDVLGGGSLYGGACGNTPFYAPGRYAGPEFTVQAARRLHLASGADGTRTAGSCNLQEACCSAHSAPSGLRLFSFWRRLRITSAHEPRDCSD